MPLEPHLNEILDAVARSPGGILVLTGAGISAESGIPTFRGPGGFWTRGSEVFRPEELATRRTFDRDPELVWPWYLWRRNTCSRAEPNAAHHALTRLDRTFGDRVRLVTQNVDGLHVRAGSPSERTWMIHGDLNFMRCASECSRRLRPVPESLADWDEHRALDEAARTALHCADCRDWMRPHVLWFDEFYDEEYYRLDSAQGAASRATLLIVVGTMGATNLPQRLGQLAWQNGAAIIDVNLDDNPFAELAGLADRGSVVRGPAATFVPRIVQRMIEAAAG